MGSYLNYLYFNVTIFSKNKRSLFTHNSGQNYHNFGQNGVIFVGMGVLIYGNIWYFDFDFFN